MITWKHLTITATIAIFSCQGGGEIKSKGQSAKQQVDHNDKTTDTLRTMQLVLQPDTFVQRDSNKMSHYIITNKSDEEVVIPSSFVIEKLRGDKWEMIPLTEMLVFEDITYAIPPKGSKEFGLALSRVMKDHEPEKGHYRFVKEAWIYGQESKKTLLTAEFDIN